MCPLPLLYTPLLCTHTWLPTCCYGSCHDCFMGWYCQAHDMQPAAEPLLRQQRWLAHHACLQQTAAWYTVESKRAGPPQRFTAKLYTVSATCRRTLRPPKAQERELHNMPCQQDTHTAWRRSGMPRSRQLAQGHTDAMKVVPGRCGCRRLSSV
jgi:hypothetical protein